MMETNAVRALLAYGITLGFFGCFAVIVLLPMDATHLTLVGTMLGALLANWKVPLAYFYDGLPKDPPSTPPAAPPESQP